MSNAYYNLSSGWRKHYDAPGAWSFARNLATHIPGVYDFVWADRDGLVPSMSENLVERDVLHGYFEDKHVLETEVDAHHFCRYLSLMCNVSQPLTKQSSTSSIPLHRDRSSKEATAGPLRYHKGRFSSRRYNCDSMPPSPIGSGRPSPQSSASSSPTQTFASLRTPGQTPPPSRKPAPHRAQPDYTAMYEGPPILKKLENAHLMSQKEIDGLPELQRVYALRKREARLHAAHAVAQPVPAYDFHRPSVPMERKSLLLAALMGRVAPGVEEYQASESTSSSDDGTELRDASMAVSWMES
ncbi:hypothetical protein PsYK624_135270 [Phanerochaete sordida]|uniref:Uncharacterized protein n=1 Tax=Phanerochaete sordida TaxID=48140 RepID=A0A9P3GLQ4_9APHY|nr:hypothetical protein PsYK624_135270 [Phanerochaete sordida]